METKEKARPRQSNVTYDPDVLELLKLEKYVTGNSFITIVNARLRESYRRAPVKRPRQIAGLPQ